MPITIIKYKVHTYDNLADFKKYSELSLDDLRLLLKYGSGIIGNEYVHLKDISEITDTEIGEVENITHSGSRIARKKVLKKIKKKLKGMGYEQSKDKTQP